MPKEIPVCERSTYLNSRKSRVRQLLVATAALAVTPMLFADALVDPFGEGHTTITDYMVQTDGPYFLAPLIGGDWQDDDARQNLIPGYGDVLFSNAERQRYFALQAASIGLDSPYSRGRLFIKDPGTVIDADGGFSINGNGSSLSITDGAEVYARYGIDMTDAVAGGDAAQLTVSGRDSYLFVGPGDIADSGRLMVDPGVGETKVRVTDGGRVHVYGRVIEMLPSTLSIADIHGDFEVSGAGSTFETSHQLHLRTGEDHSARIIDGGLVIQTEDMGSTLERPVAFSFSGETREENGLLLSGPGSQIDLINDALFSESGFVTIRDEAVLSTQGSVFFEGESAGATQVFVDGASVAASRSVIGDGAVVTAKNESVISGDVVLEGGQLDVANAGLTVVGDLTVESGMLALEIGASPALAVEGTALFGPNSFIRLLLSAVPNGEILVDDYLIADAIEFEPQFSLAAALDLQGHQGFDLSDSGEFSVRFAGLNQTVTYNGGNIVPVPEIDGAKFPLAIGLLALIMAIRRERRRLWPTNIAVIELPGVFVLSWQ